MPSSLTTLLPLALGFSPHLPVSVCGTGTLAYTRAFLASKHRRLPYYISVPFARVNQRPGSAISKCPSGLRFGGYGISTVCASTTPRGLALAPGLPWADEPSPRNLRFSAIVLPIVLHPVFDAPLPLLLLAIPSFGYMLSPVIFSAQGHSTSELLRTLLMSGCF